MTKITTFTLWGCLALFGMFATGALSAPPKNKDETPPPLLSPEKVADYIHAIIEADRKFYTAQVVNRMQERGIVKATEHWENEGTLPLPAQFLKHSGQVVAENGSGIRYRLISLWPINQQNSPATAFERKALETLADNPAEPYRGIVTSGKKRYFQAIYADRAVSAACVSCHNQHPLSPKRDFRMSDIMGGIAITIPVE